MQQTLQEYIRIPKKQIKDKINNIVKKFTTGINTPYFTFNLSNKKIKWYSGSLYYDSLKELEKYLEKMTYKATLPPIDSNLTLSFKTKKRKMN
ncbi:hypothetical protein ['Catharanthus roseus' aster yellows phytoplasma]|uniref:Uncharacterized protein n=1 Tax='Catharanthus roseus' aster yellows phytoplasma TaxID=1193712 RepID=A0A4P6MEJ5_9MOLU|nr:hypothetical protein ['Catharanthus roseus' aster yellows phytoplasma]QBF24045.1 hypothetical protein EXT02_02545 ['Catharanthus roseus' aster yellows phytoplasma]